MTNQTAHPPQSDAAKTDPAKSGPGQSGSAQSNPAQSNSAESGAAQAGVASSGGKPSESKPSAKQQPAGTSQRVAEAFREPPPPPRRSAWGRGSGLLLVLLILIAAAFTILLLAPDRVGEMIAALFDRTPSATITVGRTPGAQPSVSPSPSSAAVNGELQQLRTMVADLTARLGSLEKKDSSGQVADLENRLNSLDARIAGLIEQPVVTPNMLADALTENRQAAQDAAQEAAQEAAKTAADAAAKDAMQGAVRDATQAAERAARDAVQQQTVAAQKDMAPALAEIEKRLAVLEKMAPAVIAIADIEKRVTSLEKMAPAVAAIADQERRLASLEKTAASAKTVADLDHRLAGVEKTAGPLAAMSQSALQGEALALGLLNLRLALDRGAPYADILSALRVAAASDPVLATEVERLAPSAASGAPTLASLRKNLMSLPVAVPKPVAADQPPPEAAAEERGFWGEIWQRFASMVSVRRLDVPAVQSPGQAGSGGNDMAGAAQRAAAHLAVDDLAGAIALLDDDMVRRNLNAEQQTALDDWLRAARARLTAETGFANLSRRSLALFSAKANAPASQSVGQGPAGQGAAAPGDTPPGP